MFLYDRDIEITGEVVRKFIDKHKVEKKRYLRLKNMYEGEHSILKRKEKPKHKPDNRIVVNYAKYIVDTLNGFFVGIPPKINHDDKDIDTKVDEFDKINNFNDNISELSKICSIYGHGFEFLWQDEDSNTRFKYLNPLNTFIVYDNSIEQKPLFAVHYFIDDEEKINGNIFTSDMQYKINDSDGELTLEENKNLFYDRVPIIEYIENEERKGAFEGVETLINAYNNAISEKANDVDYFADAYLKILGVELSNEQMEYLKENRVLNLYGRGDIDKLVVEFMQKPNADQTQENLINRVENLIYQMAMVANLSDESFGNASSGVALEFKLQAMKNLVLTKERKFVKSMSEKYKMFMKLPSNISANKKDEWFNLKYMFTRNLPKNLVNEAEVAKKLSGIVSKQTQLKVLSIVDNENDEIDLMKKEEESNPYISLYEKAEEKEVDINE